MSDHTLNRKQAAAHLGVSVKTLSRYMKNHGLPAVKAMGGNNRMEYRFSADDLDKWSYVRHKVEYKGTGQDKDKGQPQEPEIVDKGQGDTGQGQDKRNISEVDKTGQDNDLVSLLLSSLQQQIATLESQLAALQDQLTRKDEQIGKLQASYDGVMQLYQAQMNRLEHTPASIPKKPVKKPSGVPEEKRKEVLAYIVKQYEKGTSFEKIAKKLNNKGESTFSGKGEWQGGTVQKFYRKLKK